MVEVHQIFYSEVMKKVSDWWAIFSRDTSYIYAYRHIYTF